MMFPRIPTPALDAAALRLTRWLDWLDPEDSRLWHRAAPKAWQRLTQIRRELEIRHLARRAETARKIQEMSA